MFGCIFGYSGLETVSEVVRSSTKIQWSRLSGEELARSLTIIRKSMGPSLVPQGKPAWVCVQSEKESPIFTCCVRSERKLEIHLIMDGRVPVVMSFWTRMLRLIRSKALLKSR